jgi:hypothetical protein
MERYPFPGQGNQESNRFSDLGDPLPLSARTTDELGSVEYFTGQQRFLAYPIDAVMDDLDSRALTSSTYLPVVELDLVDNGIALYRLPKTCITLMGAAVENLEAENNRAMIKVWEKLGDLLRALPPHHMPNSLSLRQILIDQKTGAILFLPTVVPRGESSIEAIAHQLEQEYTASMFEPEQRQKLKLLTAHLLRRAASTEH